MGLALSECNAQQCQADDDKQHAALVQVTQSHTPQLEKFKSGYHTASFRLLRDHTCMSMPPGLPEGIPGSDEWLQD